MPTFTDELVVERTGNWNSPNPSIGNESLVVMHSENGIAPGVTFSNLGGGHFSQQFTFGSNANLPGGVAATISADWHGLTLTGQQGLVFSVGPISATPPVVAGTVVFNANASISENLSIAGEVTAAQDVNVNGKLTAKQLVSPTIASLQATIQNSQAALQQVQADIQNIYNDIAAITSRL